MKLAAWLLAFLSVPAAMAQMNPSEVKAASALGFDATTLSRFDHEIAAGKFGNVDSPRP
jgi:hypothetical protein